MLAIAFLATAASFIIDMVGKDSGSVDGGGSGGGASGGGRDTKPPVIELAKGSDAIFVYVGENVSWKTAVRVTDDSGKSPVQRNGHQRKLTESERSHCDQ